MVTRRTRGASGCCSGVLVFGDAASDSGGDWPASQFEGRLMLAPVTSWSWESADGSRYIEMSRGRYHAFVRVGGDMVEVSVHSDLSAANRVLASRGDG